VLSAYALLEDGRPVLLHLDLGPRESYGAWLSFLQDLVARGLRDPLLVVMDGAPGLVKAVKRVWPRVYRQRCLAHTMRNIVAKLPRLMQAKMKELVTQVFRAPSYATALKRGRDLIAKFKDRYPAAMEWHLPMSHCLRLAGNFSASRVGRRQGPSGMVHAAAW
jgi:putative transposase